MLTRRNPVLLGARVDLEDVGPRTEDGLLTAQEEKKQQKEKKHLEKGVSEVRMCNHTKRCDFASLLSDIKRDKAP